MFVIIKTKKDIKKPNFVGGDSWEWCVNHNEFHVAIPKDVELLVKQKDWDNRYDHVDAEYNGRIYSVNKRDCIFVDYK